MDKNFWVVPVVIGGVLIVLAQFVPWEHQRTARAAPQAMIAVSVVPEFNVGECAASVLAALVNDPDIRLEVARATKHYVKKFADPEGRAQLDQANTAVAYCMALQEALATGGPADDAP